jgi:ribonuclease BN (tRNA processing enzyme)
VYGNVTVSDVGLILISHLHPDHCSDLVPFLFALRAGEMARREPLRIIGPKGLQAHYRALKQLWQHRVEPVNYDLYVEESSGEETVWGTFRIEAARTIHSETNLAWHVRGTGECSVIMTGDGEPTAELVEMGRSSRHVLIAECSLTHDETLTGHMNASQAGDLARRCRSEKLVLTHLNPGVRPGPAGIEARKEFDGEVVVAEDGMTIEV